MSLVHTIILPLIVIYNNITTEGVFVGTFYWTLQPLFLSFAVWSSVRFCSCASARLIPTSWLFSIAAFRSAVKDMIGISRDTFGKMKGGARKQATLIQNEAIVCRSWFSCAILLKCVSHPFFLRSQMSFEEDNYEPRSDGGDSCLSVPMAIRSEEITLHSSSLK